MAITTAQVHAAADQIDRSGARPTLAAIRAILKGGSFTTIQQAMLTWKKLDDEQPIEVDDMPKEVTEEGEKMTAVIWQLCKKLAGSKFDEERKMLTDKLEDETKTKQELMSILDGMAKENDDYRDKMQAQSEELAATKDEAFKQKNLIAVYEAQIRGIKVLADERLKTIEALSKHQAEEAHKETPKRKRKKEVQQELTLPTAEIAA